MASEEKSTNQENGSQEGEGGHICNVANNSNKSKSTASDNEETSSTGRADQRQVQSVAESISGCDSRQQKALLDLEQRVVNKDGVNNKTLLDLEQRVLNKDGVHNKNADDILDLTSTGAANIAKEIRSSDNSCQVGGRGATSNIPFDTLTAPRVGEVMVANTQTQLDQWIDDIQPLPAPNPARATIPGAYAESGGDSNTWSSSGREAAEMPDGQRSADHDGPQSESAPDISGLVVARQVSDEEAEIQEASTVNGIAAVEAEAVKRRWLVALACLVFAGIIGAVCAAATTTSRIDEVTATLAQTAVPSSSLTLSKEDYLLVMLPNYTRASVKDVGTPQYQAFHWLLNDPQLRAFPGWRLLQRFALSTLYFSLDGPTAWTENANWLSYDHHECQWYSSGSFTFAGAGTEDYTIETVYPNPCEEDPDAHFAEGIFRHIWLHQNNLKGSIPEELYLLTSLRSINFQANLLYGRISTRIGQLVELEALSLDSSGLTSTFPSEIGLLSSLKGVFAIHNRLEGSIPTELGNLGNLTWLYLDSNLLTGTIPAELVHLSNLVDLGIDMNSLTGSIPSEIALLSKLEIVYLGYNLLTSTIPTDLGQLENLKVLGLSNSNIMGKIPTELGRLSNAFDIYLGHNALSGTIPTSFLAGLRSIVLLSLRNNSLSGEIPSEYGLLSTLRMFSVCENNITGTIPSELGLLTSLEWVVLNGISTTSTIPSELGLAPNMTKLTLHNSGISGSIPSELAELQQLQDLSFQNTDVTGTVPEKLCDISGLVFNCSETLCGCDWCPCSSTKAEESRSN